MSIWLWVPCVTLVLGDRLWQKAGEVKPRWSFSLREKERRGGDGGGERHKDGGEVEQDGAEVCRRQEK